VQDLRFDRLNADSVDLGRRMALKVAVSVGALAATPVSIASTLINLPPRRLALVNMHTGEDVEITYFDNGDYLPEALGRIDDLMRDHRAEQSYPISTKLLDFLHDLNAKLKTDAPFQLLSGYRSPETNAMLRKKSRGVARRSYHMMGEAADVRLPGFKLRAMHAKAVQLNAGGVGYYPRSGFLHVDVGPVRAWRG